MQSIMWMIISFHLSIAVTEYFANEAGMTPRLAQIFFRLCGRLLVRTSN